MRMERRTGDIVAIVPQSDVIELPHAPRTLPRNASMRTGWRQHESLWSRPIPCAHRFDAPRSFSLAVVAWPAGVLEGCLSSRLC